MKSNKNIAILGSTGSIGVSALDVVRQLPRLNLYGISGHSRIAEVCQQAQEYRPAHVVISGPADPADRERCETVSGVEFHWGAEALIELATRPEVDTVLAAIVGRAGLDSTLAAVQAGKVVALANKETLVVAGQQVMQAARQSGATLLPVDSEHSAVFQSLLAGRVEEVERILLTASGGPFLDRLPQDLAQVTADQALAHPTWNMGKKISIDSATMMNKALEIVEAHWLFGLEPDQIEVLVHPQSLIHSLVEFRDGSVLAQLSPPDMKLPIQYALTYPDRQMGPATKMDWSHPHRLQLRPADPDQFPALALGYEVARRGGTTGAVLNGANEAAVAAFLNGQLSFPDIVTACRDVLEHHEYEPDPSIETLNAMDRWAREEISQWIGC